jgi:hypothetical protein
VGINERIEQLHRVLEAMNAWHDANEDGGRDATRGADVASAAGTAVADDASVTLPPPLRTERDVSGADGPAAEGSGTGDATAGGALTAPQREAAEDERRPAAALVDDLLPARRPEGAALEVAADVVESLGLGYHLGSAVERIAIASAGGRDGVEPLREATRLIERYIALLERRPLGADLHASAARLARTGEAIAGLRALSEALDAESSRAPVESATAIAVAAPEPDTAPALEAAPEPETRATAAGEAADEDGEGLGSFGRELAFVAARWTIMAAAVIVVVLAVTLIGQWL